MSSGKCILHLFISCYSFQVLQSAVLLPNGIRNGPQARLSIADFENYQERDIAGPGSYAFGYDIEDPATDNTQFRHEERHANGTVTGNYGFVSPDGSVHIVNYVADERGYRAKVETVRKGFTKPIKVDDEREIANAIAEAERPNEGNSLRKLIIPPVVADDNLQANFDDNTRQQFGNIKDVNYVISNNIAQANKQRRSGDYFNDLQQDSGLYQFYYVPYLRK